MTKLYKAQIKNPVFSISSTETIGYEHFGGIIQVTADSTINVNSLNVPDGTMIFLTDNGGRITLSAGAGVTLNGEIQETTEESQCLVLVYAGGDVWDVLSGTKQAVNLSYYNYILSLEPDIFYPLNDPYAEYETVFKSQALDHSGNDNHGAIVANIALPNSDAALFEQASIIPATDDLSVDFVTQNNKVAACYTPRSDAIPNLDENYTVFFWARHPSQSGTGASLFFHCANNGTHANANAKLAQVRVLPSDLDPYPGIRVSRGTSGEARFSTPQWDDDAIHSWAITVEGASNLIRVYLDGALVADFTGNQPTGNSVRWMVFGGANTAVHQGPPGGGVKGNYQYFAMWRGQIKSQQEIQEIHDAGLGSYG